MPQVDGRFVAKRLKELSERAKRVGSNVTAYTGPELGRIALMLGQRNVYGGYNWDTRVRNRSAKYTATLGTDAVRDAKPMPEQTATAEMLDAYAARIFGGKHDGKTYTGHANQLPVDMVQRVMGSGVDKDFTFNCNLLVTTKNRANHHVGFMWGKMLRRCEPVSGAESFHILLVPDLPTGDFGRFYVFPEENVTLGVGCDYMGEAKKGFLRMAMWRAKQKGILGIHAGTKMVVAKSAVTGDLKRYAVAILGNSGTGKTTNVGHTHYLDQEGEQSLVVQDDFVGLRLKDGRVLGTEQALFLKTDLDEDDVLLRPSAESAEFVSQNLYIDYEGNIQYLEEDLCANGRGILPITALPADRRYESIDLPPLDDVDSMVFIFNTRRNTIAPILREMNPEQAAAYFMLGESIETAAGDPTKVGQSIRTVGTNPFIVGDKAEEGNIFYDYLKRYESKVRCFLMNTGGVGEIPNPSDPKNPKRQANRPWKTGVGYITRALFRETGVWNDDDDFGMKVLAAGVTGESGKIYDMAPLDPRRLYDTATREQMVTDLNRERLAYLEKFPSLDPKIVKTFKKTHRL